MGNVYISTTFETTLTPQTLINVLDRECSTTAKRFELSVGSRFKTQIQINWNANQNVDISRFF